VTASDRREIIKAALRARARIAGGDEQCFCIFDGVQAAGVDVRFLALDSLEGMYCKSVPPTAIISSRRPEGRQRFTCAHEFGHHALRHEASLDPIVATSASMGRHPNEIAADLFAALLLMPTSLVQLLFRRLQREPERASALDVFAVASAIGVGYSTLVTHMRFTLGIISAEQEERLSKASPRSIRASLQIPEGAQLLVICSGCWAGRPLDVPAGGYVLAHGRQAEALITLPGLERNATLVEGALFRAATVGTYQGSHATQVPFVRVYEPGFQGRAVFRFIGKAESDEGV
jgi:Zn-dependent peptidase ImmA (M78 family)